jgi:hypothetical protein
MESKSKVEVFHPLASEHKSQIGLKLTEWVDGMELTVKEWYYGPLPLRTSSGECGAISIWE